MADLSDILNMITMPQGQSGPISVMNGANTPPPQPVPDHPEGVAGPVGGLMPNQDTLLGHHVNNLLQVTGNLTPPPGVSTAGDQTQANIPGGAQFNPGQAPTPQSPDPSDPHYFANHVNGPFKLHGVAGDILGHVMDAVLVGAGLKPEYGPRSLAAKQQDALDSGNPAVFGSVAGPEEAQKYQTNYIDQQKAISDTQAEKDRATTAALVAKNKADAARQQVAYNVAGTLEGKTPGNATDEALAKVTAERIRAMNAQFGLPTDDVPDDVAGLQSYAQRGVKPYEAMLAGHSAQSLALQQKNIADEIVNRNAATGLRAQEVGLRGAEVGDEANLHRAQIANMGADNSRADSTAQEDIKYKEWLMAHPTKARGGSATTNMPPPRHEGDVIVNPTTKAKMTAVKTPVGLVWK